MISSKNEPNQNRFLILTKQIIISTCFLLGFVGTIYFLRYADNMNAGFMCLLVEISALGILIFSSDSMRKDQIQLYSVDMLKVCRFYATVSLSACIFAGSAYVYLGVEQKQGFQIKGDGYFVSANIAFISAFFSFLLFWDTKKYLDIIRESSGAIYLPQV